MFDLRKVHNWAEVNKPAGWQVIDMVGIRDGVGYQQYVRIDGPGVGVLVRPDEIAVGFLGQSNVDQDSPAWREAEDFAKRLCEAAAQLQAE